MSAILPATAPPDQTTGSRDSRFWLRSRGLVILFLCWAAVRLYLSWARQLVPDESYYWVWSRHLALSYVDHPPVIALLIRAGTELLGANELGVRWMMTVLTAAMTLIMTLVARRQVGDWRAVAFVPLLILLSPLINAIGSLATPDTPACFFQVAALACVRSIFAPNRHSTRNCAMLWLAFGLFMGLALLSKYTSVLLGGSVFLALLWAPEGRRHLRTPWPWLAAIISIAVFSPVIIWNQQHQWISFRFQFHHGLGTGDTSVVANLLSYVGGQFMVANPVLFLLTFVVLWSYGRRRGNPMHIRILILATITPLMFFALSALNHRPEANWPMFAYLPATLLIANYLAERWTFWRESWAKSTLIGAIICTLISQFPEPAWILFPKLHITPWEMMFGWRQLAAKVDDLSHGAPVYSVDYEYASELSFYLAGHPDVWPLRGDDRPTVFNYLPDYVPPANFDRVILVRKQPKDVPPTVDWRLGNVFPHIELINFDQTEMRHLIRKNLITLASR